MMRLFGAVVMLWLCASAAFTHSASRSFSNWQEDGHKVKVLYSIDQVQATLLIPLQEQATALPTLLAGHLAASLKVSQNDVACPASLPEHLASGSGTLRVQMVFSCPANVQTKGWSLRNNAFFDLASTHIHIAQIDDDTEAREFIFTDTHRQHTMRVSAENNKTRHGFWANFSTYIQLGITHILRGFDHLAFVAALILLARSYKGVALLVTGFTLGHSITLSLAALGYIHPDGAAIEALIGFSIAFVAMEILLVPGTPDWRGVTLAIAGLFAVLAGAAFSGISILSPLVWGGLALFVFSYGALVTSIDASIRASLALTIAFGLVHGAGFASVLFEAGLPAGQRLAALGGFNIGVEIGQLAVVALLLVITALATRVLGQAKTRQGQVLASAIVFTLGIYWFASRAFA